MSDYPLEHNRVNPWTSATVSKRWAAEDGAVEDEPLFDAEVKFGSFTTYEAARDAAFMASIIASMTEDSQ